MLIALHKNIRTTPAVRAEISASNETASVLAQRYGITEQTVYKWKKRDVLGDRSHTRPITCRPCSRLRKRPWWSTCGAPCCCPRMT
jgi:hypothetical protein